MSRRGFTLIELMIALALAGLVVGGALQLHIAFNRQSQRQQAVAEVQQTLRVSMALLEKAIRVAGQGLPSSHSLPAKIGGSCTSTTYYGFQWSNDNKYVDPRTTFYNQGNNDSDPDWFRVIASDTIGPTGDTLASWGAAPNVSFLANGTSVQTWTGNPIGDFFFVIPDSTTPQTTPTWNCSQKCLTPYQVTGAGYTGTPTPGTPVQIQAQTGVGCGNNPSPDQCRACALPGAAMRHVPSGGTVYRILNANDADFPQKVGTQPTSPKLVMASAPFGTASSAMPYVVLADNIEDMQIAVILSNGTVCGATATTNSDDPAACNFANAAAVRVTLVGRSSNQLPSTTPSPVGGYEDEPTQLPMQQDGYIRRALTTTIILRNFS